MLNVAAVNALDRTEFTSAFGRVFEHSAWVAERSWSNRPFATRERLHSSMCDAVEAAADGEKLALIRAHPDLVGRAVLTAESQNEQASAGLGALTAEEIARFEDYNREYRERFGFPFVICARLNKKEAILEAFPKRLQNPREKEIATALGEIYKIA